MANYNIALAEVDEILNHVESTYILKIPKDILEVIKAGKAENIDFKYNPTQKLLEQNIHKETLEILSYLSFNFWTDESEKKEFEKIYYDNFEKIEAEKRAKYNPDDLFKNIKSDLKEELPVVIEKKTNFFARLIEKIKAIIR